MRLAIPLTALLLGWLQQPAACQLVELSLPQLTGDFAPEGFHRSTNVHLGSPPDSVYHVWIRIIGAVAPGARRCWPYPDFPCPADLSAHTYDDLFNSTYWVAGALVPEDGEIGVMQPLDVTLEFHTSTEATWQTLMTGHFELDLNVGPPLIIACPVVIGAHGSMTDVRLSIEGRFPSPVSPTTWGQLKSLWHE